MRQLQKNEMSCGIACVGRQKLLPSPCFLFSEWWYYVKIFNDTDFVILFSPRPLTSDLALIQPTFPRHKFGHKPMWPLRYRWRGLSRYSVQSVPVYLKKKRVKRCLVTKLKICRHLEFINTSMQVCWPPACIAWKIKLTDAATPLVHGGWLVSIRTCLPFCF